MFTLFVTCDPDWSHTGIDQSMEVALIHEPLLYVYHRQASL